jgi:hypothetical protein
MWIFSSKILFSEIYIFEGNTKYDEHLGIYHLSKWNSQNN